jgi:hypothetical protein
MSVLAIFRQLAAQSQAMDYNRTETRPMTSLKFVSCFLLVLTSVAAARCPELNPSWVVDDDRIAGVVSVDGRPLKEAKIQLSSPTAHHTAVTDGEGAFLISNVADGSYSFVVKGWGEAHLQVKGWHRGGINRPALLFNSIKRCLLLTVVSN